MNSSIEQLAAGKRGPCYLAVSTSISLVARLGKRENDAWRDFLSLYTPLVICWCKRKGIPRPEIGDVAQNVFREVVTSVVQFRKEQSGHSFRGWLCRIVHRQIAKYFGHRPDAAASGGSAALSHLRQITAPADLDDDSQVALETAYLYQQAVRVIRGEFSQQAWEIFWRLIVDERNATEVATEHQLTPAAVRQIKSRVLRRLKQVVGDVPD